VARFYFICRYHLSFKFLDYPRPHDLLQQHIGTELDPKIESKVAMAEPMTEHQQTPLMTPKRKRNSLITPVYTTATFAFEPRINESDDERSPQSKVVHKFRGLAIQGSSGGGVAAGQPPEPPPQMSPTRRPGTTTAAALSFNGAAENDRVMESVEADEYDDEDVDLLTMRKRRKVPEITMRNSDGPALGVVEEASTKGTPEMTLPEPDPALLSPARGGSGGVEGLQRAYPSINRLSESKSRGRKRVGTPPPSYKKKSGGDYINGEDDEEIVDPIRAALTWHDDEITMYDPNDEDDDGTGINGIGFKPTPAIAYARAMKRKQQLAEYKKRQESEARAKRSQRRNRRSPGVMSSGPSVQTSRKVRFMEASSVAEAPTAMATT